MKFQFKAIKEAESKLKFSESSPKIQGKKKILILSQTMICNLITVFNKNRLAINLLANSIQDVSQELLKVYYY